MDEFYNLKDLMAVRWQGDENMTRFLEKWDTVTEGMGADAINEKTLRDLFLEQLRVSKALQEDVAHYLRLSPSDPNKTLDFLRECVERSIKMMENKLVVEERHKNWRSTAPAAIGTAETTRTPGKGKDKKTGVANSKTPDPPTQGEKLPCFFHNEKHHAAGEGCSKGKDACGFAHTFVSRAAFDLMTRPMARAKGEGRDASRSQRAKAEKGNISAQIPLTNPTGGPDYCRRYLDGYCRYGDKCKWTHPSQRTINKLRKEATNAATKTPPVGST